MRKDLTSSLLFTSVGYKFTYIILQYKEVESGKGRFLTNSQGKEAEKYNS